MQSTPRADAVETLDEKGVMRVRVATCQAMRYAQAAGARQRLQDELPASHVVPIVHARKLRNPQLARRIGNARLRACTAERAARRDQHAKPLVAIGSGVVDVALERKARFLQLAQLHEGRCRHAVAVVEERSGIADSKAQRADTKCVVNPQQIVRLVKPGGLVGKPFALLPFQAPAHQQSPPTIRARIGKYAESLEALRG